MDQTISLMELILGGGAILATIASLITLFVTRLEYRSGQADMTHRLARLENQYDELSHSKGFVRGIDE